MASIGQELLDVPFAEMVVQLASAIAEGQYKMDMVSCKIAEIMGNAETAPIQIPDFSSDDDNATITTSMIGAGFQPTFYQFTDTIIEVKIAIKITKDTSKTVSAKGGFSLFSASVNASYTSKYSYSAEGSSLLRTKITPVPPSTFMEKLLELKAQKQQQKFELAMKQMELKLQKEQEEINEQIENEEKEAAQNN